MIQITITANHDLGKTSEYADFAVNLTERIQPTEVSALWNSVKQQGIQGSIKGLLEKLCADQGLDSTGLLE